LGDMQFELNKLSKEGRWAEMGEMITDDLLNIMGVMGEPSSLVAEIKSRYGDFTDRTSGGFTFVDTEERVEMIAALRA